jgi:uncharacterized protein (TIGR00369 family)
MTANVFAVEMAGRLREICLPASRWADGKCVWLGVSGKRESGTSMFIVEADQASYDTSILVIAADNLLNGRRTTWSNAFESAGLLSHEPMAGLAGYYAHLDGSLLRMGYGSEDAPCSRFAPWSSRSESDETMITRENDPDVFQHVEPIFHDAAFIRHLGITLEAAGHGWCRTSIAVGPDHLQQHGFVHAGVITTLADHTAGGAARAAVAPGIDVITIEFKINFLKPAKSDTLAATGQVLRAGKTIIASESEVYAMSTDGPALVAKCMSTLAVIPQGQRVQR